MSCGRLISLRRWLVFVLIVWAHKATAETNGRHLNLRAGDTEEVSYPPGTDLVVSRRGIVDVFHLGDGRWQVTALHAGFVVIDAHDAISGEPRWPRLFIDIPAGHAPAEPGPLTAMELPPWICKSPEVRCDRDAGMIGGVAPSVAWYAHARATCLSMAGCYFAANLTQVMMTDWIKDLQNRLGANYVVRNLGGSVPIIEVYCGRAGRDRWREEVDALTNRALTDGMLWLRCREEFTFARYRLHVRMYSVEAAEAAALGLAAQAAARLSFPLVESSASLISRLEALARDHHAEIIGEPVLRLAPNQPAELMSGGEFQVIEHVVRTDHPEGVPERVNWKQQGLSLRATVTPSAEDRVHLTYEMSFKARTDDAESLAINSLKSEIDLAMRAPVMVGILDMRTQGSESSGLPLIEHLPLIGPLLRRSQHESTNSRLVPWLTVQPDDATGELPASGGH